MVQNATEDEEDIRSINAEQSRIVQSPIKLTQG